MPAHYRYRSHRSLSQKSFGLIIVAGTMCENGFDKSREIRAFIFSHGTDEQHAAVVTAKLVSTILQR